MKRKSKSHKTPKHKILFKAPLVALAAIFVIITYTGCSNKEVSKTEFALNTTCTITVYDMDTAEAEDLITDTFHMIRDYENMLSRTVKGSDIYRINNSGGASIEVGDETIDVLKIALDMADISEGKFDPTVGALTELWNFTEENPKVPDSEAIDEAVSNVEYEDLVISGGNVCLTNPESRLDLGGIAKGYIADKAEVFMRERGTESAVINLGGNVTVIGGKPDGTPWKIGIERPYSDNTEIIGSIEMTDGTLSTSGIYERKFEEDGVLYHHVLDPETGYPAKSDLEAVTIKAKSGNSAFCDGLSTVCLIIGSERAEKLVSDLAKEYPKMGLEAAFIDKEDVIMQTDGMDLHMEN